MMTDPNYAEKMASVVDNTRKVNTNLMTKSEEYESSLSLNQPKQQPLDLARVEQMKTEDAARATMGDDSEDYSGVVELATKLYDEKRTERGQRAMQNMQQPANAFQSPIATAINRAAETNKAANIGETYNEVINNPSFRDAIMLNANKSLVKALEANPSMSQEEQQKLYNETIDKQLKQVGEGIDKYLRGKNELKGGGEYVLRSAIQNSLIGKAMQTAIQSASGSDGELAYQQQALADYDANKAKWWEQGLGIAGGLALDAPLMQGIGSAANATMGRATIWGLGKIGGKGLQMSTLGRMATGAAVSSGTLGGYNATSALANQLMEGRFDVGEIASSAGHGFMLGALTGAMSPWLRGVSSGMGKVGKVATMTGGLATEAGIFSGAELMEMENPYDLETMAQTFGKNVAVIGGLKVSNLPKTVKEYKQWYSEGKQSSFSDADYKLMADFAKANGFANNEAFSMSADGVYSRSIADRVTGNRTLLELTKLEGGKERNLAIEMYNDPNVPISLKTKIAAKMHLPAPKPLLANGVRVEGNKAITYCTMPNGAQQVIEIKEFARPRNARAFANEFNRTTARKNDLMQTEAAVNNISTEPIVIARLNEQAKRNGTTYEDELARLNAITQKAIDGTITAEDVAYYSSIVDTDISATEAIKQGIKDEYGVEIDDVLKSDGNLTDVQDKAMTAYADALRSITEQGNPTTERMLVASTSGVADYVALNRLGIEQTRQIMENPTQRAEIDAQMRGKYGAWLKYFDGKMGEDALAAKLGYDLNNSTDLQNFLAEQTYFKSKAADRIAANTTDVAKRLLEQGGRGVRFTESGKVKLQGVPYPIEVSQEIADRYDAAMQGSGEPMSRIVNDALKDIIKQSETPSAAKEPIMEEMPDVTEQPMTDADAVTQQMVDARMAEIDTDLQGIEADGVQRMTINGRPVAIIKGRIVADADGKVDKTKSSTEVAYMLLDENGRPIIENGKPKIEIGVKPSNVRVEDIEQWRSVDDYKAAEEQRIRDNNRLTDEAMQMADEDIRTEEMPTESKAEEITDPQSTDELLTLCKGDRELALDVAMDELNRAQQSKGKGANAAETMAINQRIRTYQRMVDDLSKVEETPTEIPTEQTTDTQVTDDMEFIYQKDLGENHEGMEPMQLADGRYKWVGLQRGELTTTMGERDAELLDGLAKKLGVAIIPIDVADSAVNGYYQDGNIYVNTNRGAEWTMRWVAGHEMLHDVAKKSPEAYDAYKQAVLDMWGEDYIKSQVKQIIDDYAASGKAIDREQALTELVNDFGGELFSSRDGLKILDNILKEQSSKGNTGFVNTIKQWWERLKEWFGGTPYYNEAQKMLEQAYKDAMENVDYKAREEQLSKDMDDAFFGETDVVKPKEAEAELRETKDFTPTKMPSGTTIEDKPSGDFSVKSIMRGVGINAQTDGDNVWFEKDGKRYSKDVLMTIAESESGILKDMVEQCVELGLMDEAKSEDVYKMYTGIVNKIIEKADGSFADLNNQYLWLGETVYRVVHSNSDKQYKRSLDVTLVCKKNEAVIRGISELQRRQGFGVTPAQIMQLYYSTLEKGYQVPCPVCYVFSRYIQNGQYTSNLIYGHHKFDNDSHFRNPAEMTPEEKAEAEAYWLKKYKEALRDEKRNKKLIDACKFVMSYATKEMDNLMREATSGSNKLAKRNEYEKRAATLDAYYRAAINLIAKADMSGYIKSVIAKPIIKNDKVVGMEMRKDAGQKMTPEVEEVILDYRKVALAKTKYPHISRYIASKGSAAGKGYNFESDNPMGDVLQQLLADDKNYYQKAMDATNDKERAESLDKAKERTKKSAHYAARQTLRGGIRQWSWSDNIEALAPDVALNAMQVGMLGGAMQTYSKQLEGIEMMAAMNAYVNGSLMGYGMGYQKVSADFNEAPKWQDPKTGDWYSLHFDDVVGVQPYNRNGKLGLFALNEMYDRAGNILVGMNDIHIRTAMADPRIFFIIPWHASGMSDHILKQMNSMLKLDMAGFKASDYTKHQEEKMYANKLKKQKDENGIEIEVEELAEIPESTTQLWQSHDYSEKFLNRDGTQPKIELADGQLSADQLHYRELRDAVLMYSNAENASEKDKAFWTEHQDWLAEIKNDIFLNQVLESVTNGPGRFGIAMTTEDCGFVYPYEYWDKTSTYNGADVNGQRYVEYCRRLGVKPKFSGIDGKTGAYGNFVDDSGYWKLLIDRRMYDREGNYQDLTPVDISGFKADFIDQDKTVARFPVTVVADKKATSDIVDDVQYNELKVYNDNPLEVDYEQTIKEALKEAKKAEEKYIKAKQAIQITKTGKQKVVNQSELYKLELDRLAKKEALADVENDNFLADEGAEMSIVRDRNKQKQFDIISSTNPAHDDYHTWIRSTDDIKTLQEAVDEVRAEDPEYNLSSYPDVTDDMINEALQSGKVTVYSSNPIKEGVFVSPSKMQAKDYAGDSRVYSKQVSINDVAWINTDEGMFAPTSYSVKSKREDESVLDYAKRMAEEERKNSLLADTEDVSRDEQIVYGNTDADYSIKIGGKEYENDGYTQREDGTNLSVRALDAEEDGSFSRGNFVKAYKVAKKDFDLLQSLGVIKNTEWHHTGNNFRETDFFTWVDSTRNGGNASYSDLTELEPESIGAKYKANKKEIGALIGEYEKHEWGSLPKYKKPMPTLENFTDDYIKKHAVKELSSNWLTIEDINQKNIEQNEISKNRELYSPYERFQQHKLVDAKYEDRAEIRKKEWIEAHKEEIQEQYNALKAEIDKYNSNIASHAEVYANDAKGKYLMEILDLLGYSAEDAAKMVNKVHHRYNYLQRTNRAEQAREAVNREYAQKEAVMRQDFDKWFNKSIKDGKAAYVERLPNKPEFFITKKVEMNGKYGWFEASSRYNLPVYYSGYQFGSKRLYDSYIKRQSDIVKVRDEGIVKAADAYNKAIFDAESNTYFSVKGKRADESVLDYAKRMSEETGKKNLLNGGSYFSGGGLLEEGLKGIVNPTIAVEFNQKVAGVYRNNFGEHIVTADVRNVDPASLVKNIDGPVAYFHASPVCKNFSKAKQSAEELPLDKATAQSTAEFISKVRPKIVTIENVKGYRDSESMKIILDELKKQGYNYDVDVYNAADYGAYTSRERLIVRAVRDWSLPAKPMVMLADDRPSGWLEAVADIIDTLPEKKSGVAKWMDERLMAMGIDYRNINKPLYVFGSGYSKDRIGYAFADELVPTLRTKGGDVIVMPDGRVLKATPRVLARISGMSDEYEMPKTDDLAHTIVGNGIPVQLTKAVMGSLIENVKSDLDAGNTEYSIIGKRGAANLDKRDETSIRVDNMVTAEEMEKAGKDAKTIRMATGWERGADGKWRYEVKDLSMLPAEQWIGKRNKKLSDIVENADELFAAYPELANVKIKEGNGKTYGGMYSDGTITLDTYLAKLWMKRLPDSLPRANKFMNETLIHEIQHYIQEKEGFAAGGNEGMILNKDAISEIDALISDSNKLAVQYNDMIAKGVYEGREEIKEKIISLRAKANAIKKKNVIGAEGYRSLAGEVEARNAEFRSNMTDKERANTMLADTEDVAREDQIFLPDDLSDYSIKQPKDVEYEAKEQWRKENAAAITSSFFAERRLDKADKIQKLKDEINKLIKETRATNKENSEKVKEIAKEMQTYIKENIPTETQGDMTRPQFEQVIKQLSTAITRKDLEKPMRMVEYIGANTNRRALTRQMRDFLKQGFKGMTPKGLVKAKNVDGATSRVLGLAKSLYESMGKQPLGSDLRALQTKVRGIKAELEDLNNANGGAFSEYIEQINAILKKSGVDRYEEMTKYYNELSDRQDVGEIQVSELLDHINRMLPELFSIELIKEQRTQAKADSAMATKEDLEQLRNNLEDKREKGILSEEDQAVLDNMAMYELMVNLQQRQLDIDGPGTSSIASQMAAKVREAKQYRDELEKYDDKQSGVAKNLKDNIKRVNAEMEELFVQRTQAQKEVNANVAELLDNLKQLRDTGNSALKEWSKNKQERETRIVTMANASFGKDARGYWSEVDRRGGWKRDFSNRMNNLRLAALMSPALSFEYMVGVMDPRFYTNESPIYKQFIKGEDGLIKANDNFFEGLEAYNNGINEAVERFINRNAMQSLKEYFNKGDRFATEIIPFEFEVKENVNGEVVTSIVHRDAEMTRGRAAKIYAWSRMADGMAKLRAHGVTDETLEVVKAFIGQDYMDFIDWVEDEYFPKLRREKYNPIYKQMYGISMAENEHYFPFETYKKDIRTEKELEQINSDNLGGGIVGNIIERKRNNARLDFTDESPDIFDAIGEYGRKMEEWAAYAQVREDLKKVINNKQFKQHCDMLGTNYYNHFLDAARVASRLYNPQPSAPQLQSAAAKLQKVFASAAISLRVSTALKQLLSAPAFAVYSLDPAFHKELLKTTSAIDVESAIKGLRELANGNKAEAKRLLLEENWVGHYNWCVNNLPSFRERVSKGGAGNPILEEKGWSKFSDDVQSVGMLPNRLVDAFTCSVGAKAIYEYAFNKYKKTYDEATAHNMAVTDAEIAFNSSQQSSNPVFLSPLQSSKEFWLRGIMNYKNSPIGYYRNGMKANIDLYRATKALFGKPKFTINGEQVGFESNGTNPAAKAAEAAAKSIMFNFFLNYLWAFGTIGIAGVSYTMMNNDDKDGNMLYTDEEFDKATGGNMGLAVFNAATQGIPWVSGFASVSQTGQDYTPSILFSEMNNYLEQVNKEGFMSLATAQLLIDLGLKNAVGVDPEVWGQIYRGAQGIMADRPMRTEDFMNLLASPRSAIAGVAKQKVGEYGNMQDYVNARIESEREIGINETMDLGKKLNGLRTLRKSKLDGYIDEYLADKIPDYRELANKPDEKTKEERMEESNAFKNLNTLISTVRYTEEKKKSSKKIDGNEETKDKVKKIRKAVNVIHKLYASGDASSAQRIADELERRLKRGYNENGVTLDDKLKNVDIYDSTGTTEQRGTDGFDTMFDRAMLGGFDGVYLGSKLD